MHSIQPNVNECKRQPIVAVYLAGILPELTTEPLFGGWRYSVDGLHKPPYGINGYPISVNTPADWTWYNRVVQAFATGRYAGIGRLLTASCPYVVIDLDRCLYHDRLTLWAERIVKMFRSYTERSPGGDGVKIWVKGVWPPGYKSRLIEDGKIEVFSGPGHYLTLTGHHLRGTPTSINERPEVLLTLAREYWPNDAAPLCSGGGGWGLWSTAPDAATATHRPPKTQGGVVRYKEPAPRLLRRAESFPATYVAHHPRDTDRSTYFQRVVWATAAAWGKGIAWALREEIDRVSGGKYGQRIDDEMRRTLDKIATKEHYHAD